MLSAGPFCGGGADCPSAALEAQAIHNRPATESRHAAPPCRMLVSLGNVFAPSRRGSDV
jgi:hypothetical protein